MPVSNHQPLSFTVAMVVLEPKAALNAFNPASVICKRPVYVYRYVHVHVCVCVCVCVIVCVST